ncbi:MAG: MerR family transcriptional regulator [Stellaceae bacterium]
MVCCAALDLHKFVDCRRENTIAQWRVSRPMMRGKEASMSRMSSTAYSDSATDEHMYAESGPGQTELTISQMSRLYSVSLRTLRFYESRGLMKPRREGSARFYRAADQVRMGMILQGKKLGFTLTEINDLIGGKSADEAADLERQLQPHQIISQIGHLERQRDEIDSAIQLLRATHNQLSQGVM